jgi:hypothetical protein
VTISSELLPLSLTIQLLGKRYRSDVKVSSLKLDVYHSRRYRELIKRIHQDGNLNQVESDLLTVIIDRWDGQSGLVQALFVSIMQDKELALRVDADAERCRIDTGTTT